MFICTCAHLCVSVLRVCGTYALCCIQVNASADGEGAQVTPSSSVTDVDSLVTPLGTGGAVPLVSPTPIGDQSGTSKLSAADVCGSPTLASPSGK